MSDLCLHLDPIGPSRFTWVGFLGATCPIERMTTGHLHWAARMLWNACVPPENRLQPYRSRCLSRRYLKTDQLSALAELLGELAQRSDLRPRACRDLNTVLQVVREEGNPHPVPGPYDAGLLAHIPWLQVQPSKETANVD